MEDIFPGKALLSKGGGRLQRTQVSRDPYSLKNSKWSRKLWRHLRTPLQIDCNDSNDSVQPIRQVDTLV
jgi:hypothetical protein